MESSTLTLSRWEVHVVHDQDWQFDQPRFLHDVIFNYVGGCITTNGHYSFVSSQSLRRRFSMV